MKKVFLFICLWIWLFAEAQKDSIFIQIKEQDNKLHITQKIIYKNRSSEALEQIKLLNFVAAYQSRNTLLVKRKLEDRNTDLYYAKKDEQGKLLSLLVNGETYSKDLNTENLFLEIPKLDSGKTIHLNLEYQIQLPTSNFTGYGKAKDYTLLKYFFLVPDTFDCGNQQPKSYLDLEENLNLQTFYRIDASQINSKIGSNLNQMREKIFEGVLSKDVELYFSNDKSFTVNTTVLGEKHIVEFGFPLSDEEKTYLEFYVPLHLKFLKEKTGFLPSKIFISRKEKVKNDFLGNDDIKFWKFQFELFSDAENIDLDYFSLISQEVADQLFVADKHSHHWITNGLKTYLEIQYLKKFYKETLLLGNLPEYKIFGLKPLKITSLSRLKLLERYGMPYQYIMAQNLDQKIDENLKNLSNFNEFAISKFETGSLFNFIAEKLGEKNFEDFIKNYIKKNHEKVLDKKDFLDQLAIGTGYSSAFLEDYVQQKNRINFKLKSFVKTDNGLQFKISKNTLKPIPFKLQTINSENKTETVWFDTPSHKGNSTYVIDRQNVEKIIINNHYAFPESNFRDNYLYTKGIFSNAKKIKFKFFTDNPNPEYNEVYVAPKIGWNNYDKLLVGMKFQNKSLFERPFLYSFTPYYSTGTKSFTGSLGLSYKFLPAESFYRSLQISLGSSYFHYDFDLSYRKVSLAANMEFNKNPRSQISRNIVASYSYLDRELSPKAILEQDYSKYNLWNLGFVYSENGIIKDKYFFGNFQLMEDFQKVSAEAFYRWDYAQNKKISFRFFGGAFLQNQTRNNTFDLGISRVSNYAFSYNLLAQSASSGILSQQFVIAEGGFKSFINGYANQFVFAHNIDAHAWKMFNVYADFGLYKNKHQNPRFIWDSGVKLKVIPDFLEIYFPLQSSLGFEPAFKDYKTRIRYTLNFNLNSVIGYFRRGWF